MSEADEQFAERLTDDLARQLGPSVTVLAVAIDRAGGKARMTATCAAGGELFEAEVTAENELEAYQALRTAVVEQRVGRAFTRIIDLPERGRRG